MSEIPCIVSILVAPDAGSVWIRLVGAVEMGAEAALNRAADRVRDIAPRTVLIDFAGVTFAGSALIHFLIRVHAEAPRARVRLHQARPGVRMLLTVTGVDAFVTVDEHR